jgi:(p)ppGpp synthase/HD superfamily hydrolase
MAKLTVRYDSALVYASEVHRGHVRKGSDIPYLSHLLGVSALVLEGGGDEEQAIAGLLHDALEDQGERTSYVEIANRFGIEVARIVRACSDTESLPKPPWRERKEAYLAHLRKQDDAVLRVSLADKLHNLRTLLLDLDEHGLGYLDRFNAAPEDQLWYYRSLASVFAANLPGAQARELGLAVDRFENLLLPQGRSQQS